MARASEKLVLALRKAAEKILLDSNYQWGHMGSCNCGYLTQEITSLSGEEIHDYALRGQGDWSEQVEAFCPTSKFPMDLLISELIGKGLALKDLIHLERLSDATILSRIPIRRRNSLKHNVAEDVSLYMTEWADMLEEEMSSNIGFTGKQKEILLEEK